MTRLYISLPRAARRLGLSLERAVEMIHEQQLRAKLSAGRWWVETASLEALLRVRPRRCYGPRSASGGNAA